VSFHEIVVSNHQQFDDAYSHSQEFISAFKNKIQMCQVTASDKHTVQICLDRANVSCFKVLVFWCFIYTVG